MTNCTATKLISILVLLVENRSQYNKKNGKLSTDSTCSYLQDWAAEIYLKSHKERWYLLQLFSNAGPVKSTWLVNLH